MAPPWKFIRRRHQVVIGLTVAALTISAAIAVSLVGAAGFLGTPYFVYVSGTGCPNTPSAGWSNNTPPTRLFAAEATNPTTGLSVYFGGVDWQSGNVLGDSWEYQSGCWAPISNQSSWAQCGYGATPSSTNVAGGCTHSNEQPLSRFAASMVYDTTFGVFLLYGGCTAAASASYPDVCANTATSVLSDTWEFEPGGSLGSGFWRLVPSATCDSNGYPYAGQDYMTSNTGGFIADPKCAWTWSDGSTQTVTAYYCDPATKNHKTCYGEGLYGGSMVYDPYTTQCANGGNTCVLLYGGADYWSFHTATDIGPCTSTYYLDGTYSDLADFCADTLWELEGSSVSNLQWIDENAAVTWNTSTTADSWGWKAFSALGTGQYPWQYPNGEGLAFPSLIAPNCSGSGCTLVLTSGEQPTNAASGEVAVASTWYITGSVNGSAATWTKVTVNPLPVGKASEAGIIVYDSDPADSTLNGKVVFIPGVAPTGSGTYPAITLTGVYYLTPGSPSNGWTLDTLTPAPDDLMGASGFFDPVYKFILAYGGYDDTLAVQGTEYVLN